MTIGWTDPVSGSEPRWVPDEHLVHTAMVSRVDVRALPAPDRAYLVASLMDRGLTAEETAQRLTCSLRLVRQIIADPVCHVMEYALGAAGTAAQVTSASQRDIAAARRDRDRALAEAQRYRAQRDQLVDMAARHRTRV